MSKKPIFELARDALGHPAGTKLYVLRVYDYGLANDEARGWGEPCSSWSLDPDGGYPFIAIPDSYVIQNAASLTSPGE